MQTLGLMTTDLPRRNQPAAQHLTWQWLAESGLAAETEVVFFHPHRIDWPARRVSGCTFAPERGWRWGRYPLPGVVIDNVFVHIARHDPTYAEKKRTMQRAGIQILNPRLPDKWGVWRALCRTDDLQPHLPATTLLQDAEEVGEWLSRYPSVFVKPVRGSGGHGVLEIRRTECGYQAAEQDVRQLAAEELHALIEERLYREKHLLQQGLPLLEVEGHKIDLRVVLHRDGHGEWQPVATVPRMAEKGQVLTNLAQGGQVCTLEWLQAQAERLGYLLPDREQIEAVAVQSAEAVTKIRPTLAFLGIDIAPDPHGGLWTLDINPRPGRKVLTAEKRRHAFELLVEYANSLSPADR